MSSFLHFLMPATSFQHLLLKSAFAAAAVSVDPVVALAAAVSVDLVVAVPVLFVAAADPGSVAVDPGFVAAGPGSVVVAVAAAPSEVFVHKPGYTLRPYRWD